MILFFFASLTSLRYGDLALPVMSLGSFVCLFVELVSLPGIFWRCGGPCGAPVYVPGGSFW